jgi:phosphatidylserine/phosphatidylglycerophosphate/cardiolipin synthase-like enzyme
MQMLSRYSYLGLIENGVEVWEWGGLTPGKGCLHSKAAVFDDRVVVIGSCNLDPRSLGINSEDVVLIDSEKAADRLRGYIETVDLPVCQKITREQAAAWRRPDEAEAKFKLLFGKALEDWY